MKRYLVILCSIFCLCFFTVSFAADSHNYKKVVSIVYDDSGSMLNLNNYCYSDYALQILTASLGQSDELNIVKVSTPNLNNEIDLSTSSKKQNYIDTIRKFQHNGGTYFESVDTAKNWLISKKAIYGDSADYWFVVITDGEFAGMPNDLNSYFSNLNQEFNNMNYEFVLLNIGESFDQKLENAVKNSANSSVVKAKDRDSIYNSILSISNMINRGASDKIIKVTPVNSTKINVQVDLPLEKMMLLMQNTQGKVKSVKNISTGKSLSFENYDVRYESVASLNAAIVQIMDNNVGSISRGSYEIEFDSNVDINNISFLLIINT